MPSDSGFATANDGPLTDHGKTPAVRTIAIRKKEFIEVMVDCRVREIDHSKTLSDFFEDVRWLTIVNDEHGAVAAPSRSKNWSECYKKSQEGRI
jgi:hypothetical protein